MLLRCRPPILIGVQASRKLDPVIREIGSLRLDTSDAPLFVVHYSSDFSSDDFEGLVDAMVQEFPKDRRCVVIHHVGTLRSMVHALTRRNMIRAARRHEAFFNKTVAAIAVVSSDRVVRGSVTAIGWLYSTPYPIQCFHDMAAARSWIVSML